MALRRGDVVLVHYPYSSGTGSKLRPALVVQPDHNNQRLTNVILVPITTTTHRSAEPTQYLIDSGSAEGRAAGFDIRPQISLDFVASVFAANTSPLLITTSDQSVAVQRITALKMGLRFGET